MRSAVWDWAEYQDPLLNEIQAEYDKHNDCVRLTVSGDGDWICNIIFRNFPGLDLRLVHVCTCEFENCNRIQGTFFTDCAFISCAAVDVSCQELVEHCYFEQVKKLHLRDTQMIFCLFQNAHCDCTPIYLQNSLVQECRFQDLHLSNQAYLMEIDLESSVDNSVFSRCHTERFDQQLLVCHVDQQQVVNCRFEG